MFSGTALPIFGHHKLSENPEGAMMRERTKQKGGVGVGEWGADSILTEQAGGLPVFLDMSLPSCGTWTKLLQTSVSLSVKMIFGEGKNQDVGNCVATRSCEYRETGGRIASRSRTLSSSHLRLQQASRDLGQVA